MRASDVSYPAEEMQSAAVSVNNMDSHFKQGLYCTSDTTTSRQEKAAKGERTVMAGQALEHLFGTFSAPALQSSSLSS